MQSAITAYVNEGSKNMAALAAMAPQIEAAAQACIDCIANGKKIIICGNGGSAADAQHVAAEIMGRYRKERAALPAIALTVDSSSLTAIGNDYGFDYVFSRQLEGIGRPGDVLIGITTSGNSGNVIEAFKLAKEMGVVTFSLTGRSGGKIKDMSDIWLGMPSDVTSHIQEMHLAVEHMLCGFIEDAFIDGRPK